jgi:hypothetical protein
VPEPGACFLIFIYLAPHPEAFLAPHPEALLYFAFVRRRQQLQRQKAQAKGTGKSKIRIKTAWVLNFMFNLIRINRLLLSGATAATLFLQIKSKS